MGYNQIVTPPTGTVSDGSTTTGAFVRNPVGTPGYAAVIIPVTTISGGSAVGGIDQSTFDTAVAAFVSSSGMRDSVAIQLSS